MQTILPLFEILEELSSQVGSSVAKTNVLTYHGDETYIFSDDKTPVKIADVLAKSKLTTATPEEMALRDQLDDAVFNEDYEQVKSLAQQLIQLRQQPDDGKPKVIFDKVFGKPVTIDELKTRISTTFY